MCNKNMLHIVWSIIFFLIQLREQHLKFLLRLDITSMNFMSFVQQLLCSTIWFAEHVVTEIRTRHLICF